MDALRSLVLDIHQSIEISSAIGDAYDALLRRLSVESVTPDNRPMPMVLEPWPGGRWFRDLGHGQGHLWGFVQVIKPPSLIELHGPMFMSYAVAGHLQFRLVPIPGGVELAMHHQVLGSVLDEHRQGMLAGWERFVQSVREKAEAGERG